MIKRLLSRSGLFVLTMVFLGVGAPKAKAEVVQLYSGEQKLEVRLKIDSSEDLPEINAGNSSNPKKGQFRFENGRLKHPTLNLEAIFLLGGTLNASDYDNVSFIAHGSQARINADDKLQFLNERSRKYYCVQIIGRIAAQINCNSPLAIRVVKASNNQTVAGIFAKGGLSSAEVDRQVLKLSGSYQKFVDTYEDAVRKKHPNLALRQGESPKIEYFVIRDNVSFVPFPSKVKTGFELPHELTTQQRAVNL
ncbi:hypothetical protein NUACC21_17050 [Scytonema sp. NUACC21]